MLSPHSLLCSSRMLKKSAICVLASLRSSTLKRVFRRPEALEGIIHSPRSILRANSLTKCGPYLLASSLAAALLDDLFEYPVRGSPVVLNVRTIGFLSCHHQLFRRLLGLKSQQRRHSTCRALVVEGARIMRGRSYELGRRSFF